MTEWFLAFLIMVNAVVLVPMLIGLHRDNLRMRELLRKATQDKATSQGK